MFDAPSRYVDARRCCGHGRAHLPHHHRALPHPLRRAAADDDARASAASTCAGRVVQPLPAARRARPDRPAHRLRHRRDEPRPVGRDPARRRVLRRVAVVLRVRRRGARAVPLRARDPRPPGPRGREDPVLRARRARARSSRTTRTSTPRAPTSRRPGPEAVDLVIAEGTGPGARAPVQGQHGPRRARAPCSRAGARTCRASWSPSPTTAAAASPCRWRTCAACARCATATASRCSSTPAASPRTPGSSASARRARATATSPTSCARWPRSPTA